ncbi:hypothetical protein Tco_0479130 [Tanacetum coccineum]
MSESVKRHEENFNLIKEIQASTDASIRNQGASIKTLEIQIGQMSKVLQEKGFRSLPRLTETNPRDQVKSISTSIKADSNSIRRIGSNQYAVSTGQKSTISLKEVRALAEGPAPIEVVKIGHLQTLLRLTQQSSGINRRLAIKDHFFDYQSMRRIVGSAVLFSPLALLLLHILCQIVDIEAVHRYAFMIIQLRPKRLCLRNMSLSVRRPELSTDHRYPLIRDSPGRDRSY